MENRMQTVIRGASQLKVTRSRRTPGSSAGTGDRWTSRLPVQAVQPPYHLSRRGIEAGLLPYAAAHHIGVVDQQVDPGVAGPQFGCGGADGIQRGQVKGLDRDVRAGGGPGDAGGGAL